MISWVPDVELLGYQQFNIPLPGARVYPGEPDHEVVATLVRRTAPRSRRAVLYVHGWSDYFFQTHLAEAVADWGRDFYALDLRRYGRSLRDGQLAGYAADLTEYHQELDAAVEVIRDEGHDHLVLMGHSTGGLIVSLYVHDRPGVADAVVLNSPWLELQGLQSWRPALAAALGAMGTLAPTRTVPIPDPGYYLRSLSADEEGRWHFNRNLKGDPAFQPRVGWVAAALRGHATVEAGLGIDVPVLMLISSRSDFSRTWNDDMHCADLVLNVDALAARAPQLGDHVTLIHIRDGKHDLALSQEEPRRRFFTETQRWLTTYA